MNRRSLLTLLLAVPAGMVRVPDLILGWDIVIFGPDFHGGKGYDVLFTHRKSKRRWGKSVSQAYLARNKMSVREWAIREIPRLNMSPVVEA